MCTVTWTRSTPAGRSLICSRDEQRTRPPATAPAVQQIDGIRVLTPVDPRAAGTWLFVNELGFVATLLNFYEATPPAELRPSEGYRSRGLLLRSLGACRNADDAHAILEKAVHADSYAPFWIIAMRVEAPTARWCWDGRQLSRDIVNEDIQPVTTSSWKTAEVLAERSKFFTEQSPTDASSLEAFHRSCSPKGGPWGPCMARPDARTVSLSRIDLAPAGIHFTYHERCPRDEDGFSPPHRTFLPWHPDHRP